MRFCCVWQFSHKVIINERVVIFIKYTVKSCIFQCILKTNINNRITNEVNVSIVLIVGEVDEFIILFFCCINMQT